MLKYTLSIALIISLFANLHGQGQSPSSVKWKEINTEHAQIIYPEELETEAQRAANLVNYLYDFQAKTLDVEVKKIPIILFNRTTTTNGFAGLRPRRSGWYVTPSQFATALGSDDWFQTLASHEYRHVVQYAKSDMYMTKFLSTLFG